MSIRHATIILAASAVLALGGLARADIMVGDWQFNTPGDNEGWERRAAYTLPQGVYVDTAVDGSAIVLTSADVSGNGDVGIQLAASQLPLALPGGATSWGTLAIRLRQLDGNPGEGGQPMAYEGGTLIIMTGLFQDNPIPSQTNLNDSPPITVEYQAGDWVLFQWDLSALSGTVSAVRFDPVSGVDYNFEIDYVTLSAVPEPATLTLLATGLVGLLRRRR